MNIDDIPWVQELVTSGPDLDDEPCITYQDTTFFRL